MFVCKGNSPSPSLTPPRAHRRSSRAIVARHFPTAARSFEFSHSLDRWGAIVWVSLDCCAHFINDARRLPNARCAPPQARILRREPRYARSRSADRMNFEKTPPLWCAATSDPPRYLAECCRNATGAKTGSGNQKPGREAGFCLRRVKPNGSAWLNISRRPGWDQKDQKGRTCNRSRLGPGFG
jgi:hypothetical protein